MHGLCVQHCHLGGKPLAGVMARQLYDLSKRGKVVVVSLNPLATLSAVRKQWMLLERKVQIERARSLNARKIQECSNQLTYMRQLKFSVKPPAELPEADVSFVAIDELMRIAPECNVLLVTHVISLENLYLITAWMPERGLVLTYE